MKMITSYFSKHWQIKRKIKNNELYGYCLMSNHVHLLIKEKEDSISRIMSRIGTSYASGITENTIAVGTFFKVVTVASV